MKKILLLAFFASPLISKAQIKGCTDKNAINFDVHAQLNDGSCQYEETNLSLLSSVQLASVLNESSGLMFWNNQYWTHNDDSDNHIYAIDSITGEIIESIAIQGLQVTDWEEMQHDSLYIYIGDLGNNASGNRSNLSILKILKSTIVSAFPSVDTIYFQYALQSNLNPSAANTTDFDSEAFIVHNDSIYIFTKEWTSLQTSVYVIPNETGNHTAYRKCVLPVNGLISGAYFVPQRNALVLCGYSNFLQPFVYFITDLHHLDFENANKRKLIFNNLVGYQVEAIATSSGDIFYITNEKFNFGNISIEQQMHSIDLSSYYPRENSISISEKENIKIEIFPNPANDTIYIKNASKGKYKLINIDGKTVKDIEINSSNVSFSVANLAAGIYFLSNLKSKNVAKIIVR